MDAFIGADSHRPLDASQRLIVSGGQGLLDHGHPGVGAGCKMPSQGTVGPGLVGIDDQFRLGSCFADRGDPGLVAVPAELDLEQGAMGGPCGCFCHALGRAERDRVSGGQRARLGSADDLPDPLFRHLGLKVPQCAVERIAGRACGHS